LRNWVSKEIQGEMCRGEELICSGIECIAEAGYEVTNKNPGIGGQQPPMLLILWRFFLDSGRSA